MSKPARFVFLLLFSLIFPTSLFANRDNFRGKWLSSSPSPFRVIEVHQNFNVTIQGLGTSPLTTYGTGLGRPNSHVSATASFVQNNIRYTVLFNLGGIFGSGDNLDILDVMVFEDYGRREHSGNTARRVRYNRSIF